MIPPMTFDLTPELEALVRDARQRSAARIAPLAAEIDSSGLIPAAVLAEATRVVDWTRSTLAAVLALEELAAASGSVAAAVALGAAVDRDGLMGLRGVARAAAPTEQQYLGMAAVCLGLGRRATTEALARLRKHGDRPSGEPEDAPHWVLADAATELEAARLFVLASAQPGGPGAAGALVFAGTAAAKAVEAALRIVGPEAFTRGAALERCGRDVRAALLILGTEDEARRREADRLLG